MLSFVTVQRSWLSLRLVHWNIFQRAWAGQISCSYGSGLIIPFRYSIEGTLWEGLVPFWKNENNMFITPDAQSNPALQYTKWVVSSSVGDGGFDGTIMNDVYTDGLNCPYEIDQLKYEWEYNWYEDSTLEFSCVKWKNLE